MIHQQNNSNNIENTKTEPVIPSDNNKTNEDKINELINKYSQRTNSVPKTDKPGDNTPGQNTYIAPNSFDVFIKNVEGQTKSLLVHPEMSITEIKHKIKSTEGVDVANIRLIYGGKELENAMKIKDYPITKNATLQWILRLTGGY